MKTYIDKILIYDSNHIETRWKFLDEVITNIQGYIGIRKKGGCIGYDPGQTPSFLL